MANIHEDNESCKERMKELIRKGKDKTEVIREVKKEFLNVNNDTFYRWYDSVILEQDIKEWEKGKSTYGIFNSRYRPILLKIRILWLKRSSGLDCLTPKLNTEDQNRYQNNYMQ